MWFFGLIVVLLIGAVAVVASGRWGAMGAVYDDRPDMTVPARQALTSVDIESARFAVGVRGYRMDEVDTLLERVAKEVAERDRRIADLERAVAPIVESPEGHSFTSRPYDTADFDDTGTQQPILVGGDFPDPEAELPPAEDPEPTTPPATPAPEALATPNAEVEDEDDEPPTSELPRASRQAADEYERLQAEARAVLEAQSQPGPPRRIPAPAHPTPDDHSTPQEPAPEQSADAPQVEGVGEQPSVHWTSAPPPQQPSPATEPQAPNLQNSAPQDPEPQDNEPQNPEPHAQHQQPQEPEPQAEQPEAHSEGPEQSPQPSYEQSSQAASYEQHTQQQAGHAPAEGNSAGNSAGNGAVEDEGGEGWRFWPPADQDSDGAYQRPS
ncbi:DivIVA domain-containing protein [Kribbella sp. NPDC048928]|uniref:DivIVA domain-containing protein n=1 Tax=Kribbella sp. NPDC048928 TaxID=3364111 RepID=UPI003723E5D7